MGPVTRLNHLKFAPIEFLAAFYKPARFIIFKVLKYTEFGDAWMNLISTFLCGSLPFVCDILSLETRQFNNPKQYQLMFGNYPAGNSWYVLEHLGQNFKFKSFRKYDFLDP